VSNDPVYLLFVLVESGCQATTLNNQLPSPIDMTEGEAEYANDFLKANDQTLSYKMLINSEDVS
tara:strand:+ start:901 stop:1092 length:192 start_codon:yes stop_codon:yes gene_type:complete